MNSIRKFMRIKLVFVVVICAVVMSTSAYASTKVKPPAAPETSSIEKPWYQEFFDIFDF